MLLYWQPLPLWGQPPTVDLLLGHKGVCGLPTIQFSDVAIPYFPAPEYTKWSEKKGLLPSSAVTPKRQVSIKLNSTKYLCIERAVRLGAGSLFSSPPFPGRIKADIACSPPTPFPFCLFKECTMLRLFCCGLRSHGFVVVRCKMSVAEEREKFHLWKWETQPVLKFVEKKKHFDIQVSKWLSDWKGKPVQNQEILVWKEHRI